jgi:drug/metabolite transporter (DMT)-like permease
MSKNKGEPGQIKPYLFIMCAAFLWASGGTASKYLFNAGMSPYILVQYRVSFSALVIFGYLFFFERNSLKINATVWAGCR